MTKPKQPWRCQKCDCLGVSIPRATPRSKLCRWCADELAAAGLRWCTKCRSGRAPDDWSSPEAGWCRLCQRASNEQWRTAHRQEALEASRAYYAAHREEQRAYNKAYYQQKRAELLEQKRDYYRRNRERIIVRIRAYYPHRPQTSIERERQRQKQKRHIYKANERAAALRRKLAAWRRMIGADR